MANKKIQVSPDGGTTWNTLPGNQGNAALTNATVVDTVFGQIFESMQPTIGSFEIGANGLFKNVAGYQANIQKGGTATTMTAEACSLVSGKTYQITNSIKRIISYLDTLTVLDNAVDQTANVLSVDYLNGKVTFKAAYTPTTPITVTGKYIPMTQVAKAKTFTLGMSQTAIDNTGYDDAQSNAGWKLFSPGLIKVTLQLGAIFNATVDWFTPFDTQTIIYVSIDLDNANLGQNVFKGFFKLISDSRSGNQGAVEDEALNLELWVPDGSLLVTPFEMLRTGSIMNTALQNVIDSLLNQTTINGRYLPTGVTGASPLDGVTGSAFPTEVSLANSIDGMNIFTIKLQGTGAPVKV